MIQRFDITSVHSTIDDKLQKYIAKKIGHLDRYVPRAGRESAHAEVRLKEDRALKSESRRNQCTCEVTLHLPHGIINVSESTLNMYAAVDIVEAKLKQQIMKYKQLHANGALHRRLANRFSRKPLPLA
jgi:ribosomal subunit interface protein